MEEEDKVPFFKSWSAWYVLVILALIVYIALFYFITYAYS